MPAAAKVLHALPAVATERHSETAPASMTRADNAADAPLVSILTPSFNQGRFIGDCIASVESQTYGKIEHVICDGGSTDETLDLLRGSPAGVRWISEPDRGQAHAINKAFAMSRGEYLGWLNSDDAYFDRRAVECAVDLFRRCPEVDVVYGHSALVGADNDLLHLMWVPRFSARLLRHANFIVQPSVFLRARALGSSLIDEQLDFAVDRELWLRLCSEGRRFARIDRIVAIDRHHASRKVYTMQDVGNKENERLRSVYRLPGRSQQRIVSKMFRLLARLRGLWLIRDLDREPAFKLHISPWETLAQRQAFIPRKQMPLRHGRESRELDG